MAFRRQRKSDKIINPPTSIKIGSKTIYLYLLFNLVTLHCKTNDDLNQIKKWRIVVLELGVIPSWPAHHDVRRIIYRGRLYTKEEHFRATTIHAKYLASVWQSHLYDFFLERQQKQLKRLPKESNNSEPNWNFTAM